METILLTFFDIFNRTNTYFWTAKHLSHSLFYIFIWEKKIRDGSEGSLGDHGPQTAMFPIANSSVRKRFT